MSSRRHAPESAWFGLLISKNPECRSLRAFGVFSWVILASLTNGPFRGWAAEHPGSSPSPVVSATENLSPEKRKALLANFKTSLGVELRALLHRQRFEIQELNAAQRAQKKEFQVREKEARKQAFKASTSGAEKRKWMEARESRWKSLLALQASELEKRKQEQKVRRESLKHEQAERLKEFESHLAQGARPPERLWPQAI